MLQFRHRNSICAPSHSAPQMPRNRVSVTVDSFSAQAQSGGRVVRARTSDVAIALGPRLGPIEASCSNLFASALRYICWAPIDQFGTALRFAEFAAGRWLALVAIRHLIRDRAAAPGATCDAAKRAIEARERPEAYTCRQGKQRPPTISDISIPHSGRFQKFSFMFPELQRGV